MNRPFLWILAFLEGGLVLTVELCAAKLLAPYFGTSIQVWAATLAVTLGGLTSGYLFGSFLAKKDLTQNKLHLKYLLIAASVLSILMPFVSRFVLQAFLSMSLGIGATLSLMVFLFPVLFCLGSCSSLFINLLNNEKDNAGNTAGRVYAVSTLGGIVFTFLTGFLFIPEMGLKLTLILNGLLVGIATLLVLLNKSVAQTAPLVLLLFGSFLLTSFSNPKYNPKFKILHESDGILGNIKVIEHDAEWFGKPGEIGRGLMVNNTMQTFMDVEGPGISIWNFAHFIPSIAGVKPENSDALILGLGGGTIYKQFERLEFNIDVVEIDKRIEIIAKEYFKIPNVAKVHIEDARHFLKRVNKKYDVICFDAFLSESPPEHLLTKEGILDALDNLKEDGILIINFFGFLSGEHGYASRSIAKTLSDCNLNVHIIPTPGKEENRNLLFVATPGYLPNYYRSRYVEEGRVKLESWAKNVKSIQDIEINDSETLYDNKPILSHLYQSPAQIWRKGYNDYYAKSFLNYNK